MICSANEVATLAAKAARGAGAPSAQAAMFGRAAFCHLVAPRDPQLLSAALDALPDGPILDHPLMILKLLERAQEDLITFHQPASDLLLSYVGALPYSIETKTQPDGQVTITIDLNTPKRPLPIPRVALPPSLSAMLQSLAAKTLVPDTATSRLSGAGAGLTDND